MTSFLKHLRAKAPSWVKQWRVHLDLARISFATILLPRRCFVQIFPNSIARMGLFPSIGKEIIDYNRSTSLGQNGLAVDGTRVISLRMMLRKVASLPAGDYAELGTYRGVSARIIYRHMASGCELHCFDTFEGFDSKDIEQESASVSCISGIDSAFSDTTMARTESYIRDNSSNKEGLFLHKGYFPETFKGLEQKKWRFVHLDADLYQPILAGLNEFYPKLVPGGVIVLHDYYSFYEGVQQAAKEYFEPLGLSVVPLADKAGTGIVIKPISRKKVVGQLADSAA